MCSRRLARLLVIGFGLMLLLCAVLWLVASSAFGRSSACRQPATGPARPGTSGRMVLSGGRERCYVLYVPPGLDPARPAPVVVSLHGFASNARGQERTSRWNRIADAEGFVVVYPEGTSFPQRWNSSELPLARDADDVQFFRDLVADLSRAVTVDPARIYVSGISNGGAMASRVGCEAADIVAAIGAVAAMTLELPEGCWPSRPVPVIAFHGTDDPLVRYGGGTFPSAMFGGGADPARTSFDYPSVETWIVGWAERDGCSPAPEPIPAQGDARGIRYTGCGDGAEVILYTIDGGGHTWPGGLPVPLVGKTSTDIDASTTMWEFFQAHPLPGDGEP